MDLQRLTGWLKLCLLAAIGHSFFLKQGEKVTYFAWFGESSISDFLSQAEFDVSK